MSEKTSSARRALGRGLESLLPSRPAVLPQVNAQTSPEAPVESGKPLQLEVGLIDRNPFQTRSNFDEEKLKELAQSIEASGVVQPIIVRPAVEGRYQLITGERRLLASKLANRTTIPAVVREVSDEQTLEMTIVENLQRHDLNPMEQARAFQRLANDFRMTQEKVAARTGKERATVSNFLRLLRLPETIQKQVETGELSFGHARSLLSLPTHHQMETAAKKALALSFSVRQTENYVQGLLHPESKAKAPEKIKEPLDPNVNEAQQLMQRRLGLRVRIEDKRGKGRVIIEYANLEDFDLILDVLEANPTQ